MGKDDKQGRQGLALAPVPEGTIEQGCTVTVSRKWRSLKIS